MRRVVITGVGAVSPVGNTAEETWNSLIAGKNGIGPITRFDTSDPACKVKVAAEVKDFDPSLYMEKGRGSQDRPVCPVRYGCRCAGHEGQRH